ncbi:hypothetical protein Tco_0517769 [Tanacetum coccineum]
MAGPLSSLAGPLSLRGPPIPIRRPPIPCWPLITEGEKGKDTKVCVTDDTHATVLESFSSMAATFDAQNMIILLFESAVSGNRTIDKANVVGANPSDTTNTNGVTTNPSEATVSGHNSVQVDDGQTFKKQGIMANNGASTSKSNTNNMATTSSDKGPGNSNDINVVSLRNSFATLNDHDIENVVMTKAVNEDNIDMDSKKVMDKSNSDVDDV